MEPESRFDRIFRELLTFGLVETDTSFGVRTWYLTHLAQERLEALAPRFKTGEPTIYFGFSCALCHEHDVPTRLHSGVHVCEACLRPERSGPEQRDHAA